MKAHKYWAIGAAVAMAGTFDTGYKYNGKAHKALGLAALGCMAVATGTGYKMISGKTSKASEKAE